MKHLQLRNVFPVIGRGRDQAAEKKDSNAGQVNADTMMLKTTHDEALAATVTAVEISVFLIPNT